MRTPRKPRIDHRTASGLHGMAYDLETIAARLRAAGYQSVSDGVLGTSSTLGNIARTLDTALEGVQTLKELGK